jgi:hypothetical protein
MREGMEGKAFLFFASWYDSIFIQSFCFFQVSLDFGVFLVCAVESVSVFLYQSIQWFVQFCMCLLYFMVIVF